MHLTLIFPSTVPGACSSGLCMSIPWVLAMGTAWIPSETFCRSTQKADECEPAPGKWLEAGSACGWGSSSCTEACHPGLCTRVLVWQRLCPSIPHLLPCRCHSSRDGLGQKQQDLPANPSSCKLQCRNIHDSVSSLSPGALDCLMHQACVCFPGCCQVSFAENKPTSPKKD